MLTKVFYKDIYNTFNELKKYSNSLFSIVDLDIFYNLSTRGVIMIKSSLINIFWLCVYEIGTREGWVGPPRQQLLTATGNIYRIGNIGKKKLVFYSNFNVPTHFQNLQ
jgi:hypothetical protein